MIYSIQVRITDPRIIRGSVIVISYAVVFLRDLLYGYIDTVPRFYLFLLLLGTESVLLMSMHIGQRVKEVVTQQGRSVSWLAKQIHCDRTNVYLIFKRASIDTDLLQRLSVVLGYDFFQDLSEETNAKKETR